MSASLLRGAAVLGLLVLTSSPAAAQVSTAGASPCPATVADSTTASIQQPKLVTAPKPRYPTALRRSGVTGAVRLQFVVGCDGRVDSTTVVVRESNDTLFTSAAVTTIVGAEFTPAMLNGRAVSYRKEQVVRFQLTAAP
jgi:TonB family protein